MTTRYADGLYDTAQDAMLASVEDFLTSTGTETVEDALAALQNLDAIEDAAQEMVDIGWELPGGEVENVDVAIDAIGEWVDETRYQRIEAVAEVIEDRGEFAHGGDDPEESAGEWVDAGFDADEVGEWLDAGCFTPDGATRLADAGWSPEDAADSYPEESATYGHAVANGDYDPTSNLRLGLELDPIPPWALREALEWIAADFIETAGNNGGQTWLAEQCDVSPRTVRRWVSGANALTGLSARVVRQEISDVIGDELD